MKKLIKTSVLACLSLLFFNCSSDDSTLPNEPDIIEPERPMIEKTYYLRSIDQNFYDQDETTKETYLLQASYKLNYDADFNLTTINYQDKGYTNGTLVREQAFDLLHTLDEKGRLQKMTFNDGTTLIEEHTYTYKEDLLQSIHFNLLAQGGAFTAKYRYNDKKQLISANALEANLLVDYSYNEQNQMNQFKISGQTLKVTYDDKLSPFYNLPFDLTSALLSFQYVFPYTYKFPNNITSFSMGGEVSDVDFTYNEANLPTKAVYYDGKREDKEIGFEITYTYEIRETEVARN